MIHVITTVAQHPKGLGMHLRNLGWALEGLEHHIHVQTFEEWGFEDNGVHFLARDANPMDFYAFWKEVSESIPSFADEDSVFLFTEQDIYFTEQVGRLAEECARDQKIIINLGSPYLSLFDEHKQRVYPRIWEGATFLPGSVVFEAIEQGIDFGAVPSQLVPGSSVYHQYRRELEGLQTTDAPLDYLGFTPLVDFLQEGFKDGWGDTMFELSAFCYCRGVPYRNREEPRNGYHMGRSVVHIRAPETIHRAFPEVYKDIDALDQLPPIFDKYKSGTAFLYFLSEVYERSDKLAEFLLDETGLPILRRSIARMDIRADEWMTDAELERFLWARDLVGV